jgi:hypothetical protein
VKDENGDLLADSHRILHMWKNYFLILLNVPRVGDVRQIEAHQAKRVLPDPIRLGSENATEHLVVTKYQQTCLKQEDQFPAEIF